uniref:NB-ARC domain-containing protein n=1 Tax=Nelumbo nucifera TaxID=4432 RepID=A0A822ZNR0_NELNU|nr:TPA_asm: hypothetical protein HUJ06_004330 [Nelumbo nucifera]
MASFNSLNVSCAFSFLLIWIISRHQSKCIQKIIELIMSKLIETSLDVATYQVGIDTRAEEVNKLLSVQSNDVRIVGICGIGGIGKTTIAKAVYNLIFHKFEGSSFISNIREASKQPNGLAQLQEQLLYDVLKKDIRISSVSRGINLLKERLPSKRVLLVLDDVDQSDQLNALARRLDWFGLGSRIIITTRNEQLLNEFEVRNIYKPKELNHDESIQLFSWHAFGQDHPIDGYMEISKHMVACLGGLPSALEDTGSRLFDRRSMPEWESALMKLKRYPYSYSQRQKLT